jgi:hypothetical protein
MLYFQIQTVRCFYEVLRLARCLVKRKNLASDVIYGLNVIGTRETVAFRGGWPAEQWQVSTQEFWFAPDLGVNLSATSKVPIEGTQVVRVSELSRAEPDPAMFQIPANFVVEDHRQPPRPED